MITITVEKDTIAKLQPLPSDKLTESEKSMVAAGSKWQVHSYDEAEDQHIRVALLNASLPFNGGVRNTVYFFYPHISLEGNLPNNNPRDRPSRTPPAADSIRVPGITAAVGLNQPIIAGGNFTWSEATRQGTRIPENAGVTGQIIKIARIMQEIRERLGDRTITVTSFYRDPDTNRMVGGASQSRHVVGDAVDFWVEGMTPEEAYYQIEPWFGSRGGLAVRPGSFIHVDGRGTLVDGTIVGGKARWTY